MAEEETSDETSTLPPPPPTEPPAARRELRRSRDNRVIAGVAAGIGRYFDIDPVIVRIAFIVLTVFGGSGVLLYLVAWLVIAREGESDSAAGRALRGSEKPRGRSVMAILLVLAAVFLVSGPLLWFADFGIHDGLFFPLLLVAAGVALLLWPDDDGHNLLQPRARVSPGPAPEQSAPRAATGTEITESTPSGAVAPTSTVFADHPAPPAPPAPAEDDSRSFPIGGLTMALLLVVTGGAVLLDRLGAIDVGPAGLLATWLVVVGAGLVASAFVGRSVGLIVLGLVILPFLWFATVADIEWWSGVGDERVVVTDPSDLDATYRHGIGQLVVDLRDLDLAGAETALAVGLSIGEVTVIVPDDIEVVVDLDGRIGEIVVVRPGPDLIDNGFDIEIDTTLPGADGRLLLDLDVGIGAGRVEVAS